MSLALRIWARVLDALCVLLCARVLGAGLAADPASTLCLSVGFASAAYFGRSEGLLAGLCLIPLASGFEITGLLSIADAPAVAMSGLLFGTILRRHALWSPSPAHLPLALYGLHLFATLVGFGLFLALWGVIADAPPPLPDLFQARYGYGHRLYALTTATLWYQGLTCANLLLQAPETLRQWSPRILWLLLIACTLFCSVQLLTGYPESWSPVLRYFSPYPDIHAFGSAAVVLFGYFLGKICGGSARPAVDRLALGVATTLLFLSYSRAAWVAAAAVLLWAATRRFGAARTLGSALVLGIALLTVARFAAPHLPEGSYAARVSSLVKWEPLKNKSPERVSLYERSLRMIASHPVAGVGLGSFYAESVNYACADDAIPGIPNFAHNACLQVTAELGIPAGLALLTGILGMVLRITRSTAHHAFPLVALFLTQMTSNSINIYTSVQILFWVIAAMVLAASSPTPNDQAPHAPE